MPSGNDFDSSKLELNRQLSLGVLPFSSILPESLQVFHYDNDAHLHKDLRSQQTFRLHEFLLNPPCNLTLVRICSADRTITTGNYRTLQIEIAGGWSNSSFMQLDAVGDWNFSFN